MRSRVSSRKFSRRRRFSRKRVVRRRRGRFPRRGSRLPFRKRVLNISEVKKNDDMPMYSTSQGALSVTEGPILVTNPYGSFRQSLFCASGRLAENEAAQGTDHCRQSTRTFAVGYKENVSLTFPGGDPLIWRRIVFSFKGNPYGGNVINDPSLASNSTIYSDGDAGMTRFFNFMTLDFEVTLAALVFEGTQGTDWYDIITATVDRTRVSLMSDKTYTVNPSAASVAYSRYFKFYYPVGKNLVYDDDEFASGVVNNGSAYSIQASGSVGDIYIYDIFTSPSVGAIDCRVDMQGRWYWHEK